MREVRENERVSYLGVFGFEPLRNFRFVIHARLLGSEESYTHRARRPFSDNGGAALTKPSPAPDFGVLFPTRPVQSVSRRHATPGGHRPLTQVPEVCSQPQCIVSAIESRRARGITTLSKPMRSVGWSASFDM
jgi:hypothetical protein